MTDVQGVIGLEESLLLSETFSSQYGSTIPSGMAQLQQHLFSWTDQNCTIILLMQ